MGSWIVSKGTEMKSEAVQHRAMVIKFQKDVVKMGTWQCCLSCDFWNLVPETCSKFKARPPAEVIVVGCPEFMDNIPF